VQINVEILDVIHESICQSKRTMRFLIFFLFLLCLYSSIDSTFISRNKEGLYFLLLKV